MLGGIFLIIDLILFIKKKPLIYPYEYVSLLQTKAAQAEMMCNAAQDFKDDSEIAAENLQKLSDMLEKGLITTEEFNMKKAELLERM
jgi:hypothetical protein